MSSKAGLRDAPIKTADELWSAILRKAGLDLRKYDAPLVDELCSVLRVPPRSFGHGLDAKGVTIERLLLAFLRAVQPYAGMTRDIMALFARASARRSNDQLRMCFQFADSADDFEFDLRNFREWESRWREVLRSVDAGEFGPLDADEIRHAFVEQGVTYRIEAGLWVEVDPHDDEVVQWLRDTERQAPAHLPPVPQVTDRILSELIERVWGFMDVSIRPAEEETAPVESLVFDRDAIRTIVRGAHLLSADEDGLRRRLAPILGRIPRRPVELSVLLEDLDEILSMPVWKRRHEVYSVWVGSRVVAALGNTATIQAPDGVILFSFRATHLATLPLGPGEGLQLWTELRTPLRDPIGKGRKSGIQPDYVLTSAPADDPTRSLIVVECKQYLRASRRNFGAAVIDYARGHPNAFILLVNYGPWIGSLTNRPELLDRAGRPRTRIIGQFRPNSPVAIREFEAVFQKLVPKPPTTTWMKEVHVRLTWTARTDLDLHCWLSTAKQPDEHIWYGNRTHDFDGFEFELDQDAQTGPASETIRFRGPGKGSIVVAVHNYSGRSRLAECGARVEIQLHDLTLTISAPTSGDGDWWSVLKYDGTADKLEVVDALASQPPRQIGERLHETTVSR